MTPHTLRPTRVARRRAARPAAGCLAVVLGSLAWAGDAGALVVSSDAEGLKMREPDNILNRVKLSLVDSGGLKYRVEMAQFGGRGIGFGPGCTQISTLPGVDVALCDRLNPVVSQVSLGPLRDTFDADPAFPDPIQVNDGGLGPDIFTLGAGNDVSRAAREDTVLGMAGQDDLVSTGGRVDGGEGDDTLRALDGSGGVLIGGAGDDALSVGPGARAILVGGEGTDSFAADGAAAAINSRDGISEQVSCGTSQAGARTVATIDLVDTPDDATLLAEGCATVDRAPRDEATAAQLAKQSFKLRRGRVAVRVRCTTSTRCRGTLSVRTRGGAARSARYSIAGERAQTLRLRARRGAATVRLSEQGIKGARTILAAVRITR